MAGRPPRRKPFIDSIHGPIPPRHPRKKACQLVWPRDIKASPVWSWGRLKDVLTCKGPDMYVTRRGSLGPHRPVWSRWQEFDNLGYLCDIREGEAMPKAYRRPSEAYNFATRKYEAWNPHMVSDVKWCSSPRDPRRQIYWRSAYGNEDWNEDWDDLWEPGRNPFAYGGHHDAWDWDELPQHH